MNFSCVACLCLLSLCALPGSPSQAAPETATKAPPLWISGYYPGWKQEAMPPSAIDFETVTHLIHFSLLPRADGTLDAEKHGLSVEHSRAAIAAAHRAGRQVLVCVGGGGSIEGFRGALREANRARFVAALVEFALERGYDGIDLDMEPIEDADVAGYEALVPQLRAALKAANPKWLLAAATASQPAMFARLSQHFDQINVMTYDLSGPWEGWVAWHNSALSNTTARFPAPNAQRLLPSVQSTMQLFGQAGIEPRKLGLGLAFYGVSWRGAEAPEQLGQGLEVSTLAHSELMRDLFSPARRRWDAGSQVPFLSISAAKAGESRFVSYEDEQSLRLKVLWARQVGLGGAIIWELSQDYRADKPAPERNPLLRAVGRAALEK